MTKKARLLQEMQEAFANSDTDFLAQHVTDDIQWTIVGDRTIQGKETFVDALRAMEQDVPMQLTVHNIITHGRLASVDGTTTMAGDHGSAATYAFCDVYRFSGFKNPKIKEMTSYVVKLPE